jgi:hypothetical protein
MSKTEREVFEFDEFELAEEMGVPVNEVALACVFLARCELIEYNPAPLGQKISQARLTVQDWNDFYERNYLPTY